MNIEVRSLPALARMMLAAVLAYGLALQAIAGGIAGGLHTAYAQDIALQALCAPGQHDPEQPAAPDQTHDALCCVLGCHGSPLACGPERMSVGAPIRAVAIVGSRPLVDQPVSNLHLRPLGARAPPVLA